MYPETPKPLNLKPIGNWYSRTHTHMHARVCTSILALFVCLSLAHPLAQVFRTTGTAQRDIWLNRFALGQISHRIMTNTGTQAGGRLVWRKGGEIGRRSKRQVSDIEWASKSESERVRVSKCAIECGRRKLKERNMLKHRNLIMWKGWWDHQLAQRSLRYTHTQKAYTHRPRDSSGEGKA